MLKATEEARRGLKRRCGQGNDQSREINNTKSLSNSGLFCLVE
jgi:hypothetical protein